MDRIELDIPSGKRRERPGFATDATRAYHAIRHRILRCRLAPGSAINERQLMKDIGIGRTPTREALLRLSAESLIVFSGQGIQVAPLDVSSVSALYTARMHAERLAWALWMRSADAADVARLVSAFESAPELAQRGDEAGLFDLDFRFHNQVYEECGNPFLSSHLHNLTGWMFRVWFLANPHRIEEHMHTVKSHDPIIAAVRARDLEARDAAITAHIDDSFNSVIHRLKGESVNLAAALPLRVST